MLQLQSGKIVELSGPNTGIMATACLSGDVVGSVLNYMDASGGVSSSTVNGTTTISYGYKCGCGTWVDAGASHYCGNGYFNTIPYTFWNSYPVYVCHDKTAKAIEILKSLESDKIIELKSVKRFIEMVEKIAAIL